MKHYMDNAPVEMQHRARYATESMLPGSEDEEEGGAWTDVPPGTPTRPRPGSRITDKTPRPSKTVRVDETPKAQSIKSPFDVDDTLCGYTLSHLRRVPELALLARRVVEAESKRRAKDARRKRKEEETISQSHSKTESKQASYATSSASRSHLTAPSDTMRKTSAILGRSHESEPTYAKMKRLFRYAIRQLYDDGSIVMWDGPVRPLPKQYMPIPQPKFSTTLTVQTSVVTSGTGRLWKASATGDDRTIASSVTSVSQSSIEDDLSDLSDPPPEEESYVPLTSAYLSKIVENAIVDILSRSSSFSRKGKHTSPRPGPTSSEIVGHLHRRDERWAHVGEWAVKEALEWGREQGRLWCIGDGRWEVCG